MGNDTPMERREEAAPVVVAVGVLFVQLVSMLGRIANAHAT